MRLRLLRDGMGDIVEGNVGSSGGYTAVVGTAPGVAVRRGSPFAVADSTASLETHAASASAKNSTAPPEKI
jgi:hypothetical protein